MLGIVNVPHFKQRICFERQRITNFKAACELTAKCTKAWGDLLMCSDIKIFRWTHIQGYVCSNIKQIKEPATLVWPVWPWLCRFLREKKGATLILPCICVASPSVLPYPSIESIMSISPAFFRLQVISDRRL